MALMASESRRRTVNWINYGCNAFNGKHNSSRPMMFWKENDVLQYIDENKIEIAREYGKVIKEDSNKELFEINNKICKYSLTGCNRTSCKFCMFGISMERDRLLKYKERDKQFYDYALRGGEFDTDGIWKPKNGLGLKFVIDWLNENGEMFKKKPILY